MEKQTQLQPSLNDFQNFCNIYFSHPYFNSAGIEPRIRLKIIASAEVEKRIAAGSLKVPLAPKEFVVTKSTASARLEKLLQLNSIGFNLYYFINLVDAESSELTSGNSSRYANSKNIKKVLWCGIDWDSWSSELGLHTEVFDVFGLAPSIIYSTSQRGDFPASQALLGFSDGCSVEEAEEVSRRVCSVMGSCPVGDVKRLFRMPGSVNWKEPYTTGRVIWTSDVCEFHTRVELLDALDNFEETETARGLRAVYDAAHFRESFGQSHTEKDFCHWEMALKKGRLGQFSVGDGNRHNALCFWGVQMASEHLQWAELLKNLNELKRVAFNVPFEGVGDDRDFEGIVKGVKKRHEEISMEASQMLSALTALEPEGFEGAEEVEGALDAAPAYANGHDKSAGNIEKSAGTMELTNYVPPFALLKLGEDGVTQTARFVTSRFSNETHDQYLEFLARILIAVSIYSSKNSCGVIEELGKLVARRLETAGLNFGPYYAYYEAVEHRKNSGTHYTCRVVPLSKPGGELLIRSVLGCFSRAIASADMQASLAAKSKLIAANPGVKLQFSAKGPLLTALVQDVIARGEFLHAKKRAWLEKQNTIAFQNGAFEFGKWAANGGKVNKWRDYWIPNKAQPEPEKEGMLPPLVPGLSWIKYPNCCPLVLDIEKVEGFLGVVTKPTELWLHELKLSDCPLFSKFLETPFPNDPGSVLCLLRIIGYCLLETNPRQKYFYFEGVAGGGKGTIAEIIAGLVGDNAWMPLNPARLKSDSWLGALEGCKVVIIDEIGATGKADYAFNLGEVARVVGAQKIDSRNLYENSKKIQSTQKFILTTNEPLDVPDAAGRQERRIVPLKFSHRPQEYMCNLSSEIVDSEGSRIASYALGALLAAWHLEADIFTSNLGTTEQHTSVVKGRSAFEKNSKEMEMVLDKFCEKKFGNYVVPGFLIKEIMVLWIRQEHERKRYYTGLAKNIEELLEMKGFVYLKSTIPLPESCRGVLPSRAMAWDNMKLNLNVILEELGMGFDQFGKELHMLLPKERDWLSACEILRINPDIDYGTSGLDSWSE